MLTEAVARLHRVHQRFLVTPRTFHSASVIEVEGSMALKMVERRHHIPVIILV